MNLIIPNGFERNFTLGFVRGLVANGVEVLVVSDDEIAPALAAAGIPQVNARGSVTENRSGWRKAVNLLRYYASLLLLLWRQRNAVMHFTGMFQNRWIIFEGLVLNACIRLAAGRYLYTVHNVLPHGRVGSRFFRWIYCLIYRLPHILLVHTHRARQQLVEEFGVPADKIRLTSIGLNEEMPVTGLSTVEARNRLGLLPGQRCILFFGKIDGYKGLDCLLTAFDRIARPDARLIVAGVFRSTEYRAAIMRQWETMRRRSDVLWQERAVPNEEVEILFKAADALCLPYRHIYQSGLVFLGPRFGLPMVTTDVGSLREFIEDNHLGIVSRTNDLNGIVEALEEFFAQPGRFRREDIIASVQKYRWDEVCRELLPLYHAPRAVPTQPATAPTSLIHPHASGRRP